MPQWSVQGAFATTGRDGTLLVEAPTAEAAARLARDKGLLVANVAPSDQSTLGSVRLAYQSSSPPSSGPQPSFRSLRWTAWGFRCVGLLLLFHAMANLIFSIQGTLGGVAGLRSLLVFGIELLAAAGRNAIWGLVCLALSGLLDVAHAWAVRRLGPTAP